MKGPHNSLDDLRRRLAIEPDTSGGAGGRRFRMVYKPPHNKAMNVMKHVVSAQGALESTHANLR
eukprot:5223917-Pyramimonas_sp.AAC.1